jgi:hypothetical protein
MSLVSLYDIVGNEELGIDDYFLYRDGYAIRYTIEKRIECGS